MTVAFPLSAGNMTVSLSSLRCFIAIYSFLVRLHVGGFAIFRILTVSTLMSSFQWKVSSSDFEVSNDISNWNLLGKYCKIFSLVQNRLLWFYAVRGRMVALGLAAAISIGYPEALAGYMIAQLIAGFLPRPRHSFSELGTENAHLTTVLMCYVCTSNTSESRSCHSPGF